ncbi:MAG: hypothetical protein KBA61_07820, partial [Spirochaetes bacterium]|nr:hypothetical protein [Spirochaetota bacterium]
VADQSEKPVVGFLDRFEWMPVHHLSPWVIDATGGAVTPVRTPLCIGLSHCVKHNRTNDAVRPGI